MTDRIGILKNNQWEKKHHACRSASLPSADAYRVGAADYRRAALRLKTALDSETPVLLADEKIVFTRTVANLPMIYSEDEWETIRSEHFIHENGNVSNLSPDYGKIIREGLLAQTKRMPDGPYADAMRESIDAVLRLTARYADLARSQGREDTARILDRVPACGAETFREALQSLRILHYAMWCEGDYHNTLGRFDQYMLPYLRRDLEKGDLTKDEAFELLEEFFLSCNRDSDLYPGMQQGDNGQSIVLGGLTPEGKDGFNELSEMCLRASAELKLIDPKINLRVGRDTPLSTYILGTGLTKLGLGFPQYENDDVAIPGLERLGYDEADARDYAMAACWEFIIPGKGMEIPNIAALPFAGIASEALRENLEKASSMDDILSAVKEKIGETVRGIEKRVRNLYVIPSPFLSLFFEGCTERGRDISLGCKYNNYGIHGTGLAPAADMLAAARKTVFEEKMDPSLLLRAIERNFEGDDALRYHLAQECPKMGNDDDAADEYAVKLLDMFSHAVEGLRNERGGIFRAGTGSAMYYITHAEALGATLDGRKAEVPLPANYSPSLSVRLDGPVSIIKSFTKPDLSRVINGGPLTLEFSDSVFRSGEAVEKVAELVRLFILRGGHQIQLNTVSRDRLLDAQKHPENYRNLIVRVWGWSGYFVELDRCYQDHIIRRAELTLS